MSPLVSLILLGTTSRLLSDVLVKPFFFNIDAWGACVSYLQFYFFTIR